MIYLYRFCCKVRISGDYDEEMPGGEFLGVADVDVEVVRERFADLRVNNISDWYEEHAELTAYVRATLAGLGDTDLRRRLVDTEAAVRYTGRSRSTLYRWSEEDRLTRYDHGPKSPDGVRMWDVLELPSRTSVGPAAPPPRRSAAPQGPPPGPWARAHGPVRGVRSQDQSVRDLGPSS